MFLSLANLVRYRGLIWSLVARELKARYRGSVLGFAWSFINPLLLLLIYSFVFTKIMPNETPDVKPYAVFMFCGILPWNWFATSLSDAAGSLIAGGNLIKKVLFPAERAAVQMALQPEPVLPSGGVVPGDPVFSRADRPLEVAAGPWRRLCVPFPRRLLAVRPAARFLRGGGMTAAIDLVNVSKIYR